MDTPHPPPPPPPPPSAPLATCYRHDDRPTRLSCSSCGRPICIDCTRQAAVGQKCPECAAPQGRNRVITASEVRARTEGLGGAPVIRAIMYVTVAIGVLGIVGGPAYAPVFLALVHDIAAVDAGQVHRAVTAALLHGGVLHLAFNMYALFAFGPELERRFGSAPFALLYLATAAAGGLAFQISASGGRAVGASGAIFGLFGAYLMLAFLARTTAGGQAMLRQLLPLLALNLALPLFIRGIAWEAHVGGLIAGAIIMFVWRQLEGRTAPPATGSQAVVLRSAVAGTVLVASIVALLVL